MKVIDIAAALLVAADGRTLLVRKRGTRAFMQPGGKIEAGEPALQALMRELEEELALRIEPDQAVFLGELRAAAANEPGFEVRCQLFRVNCDHAVQPAAEIEEVQWVDARSSAALELAPLTRDQILPQYWQTLPS
ncbi:NUDIX domain-containing protein [Pseudomonas sp. 21LCFQ010]|uniref:NUDIX hydrolase n=1 Tax=Pseudomonas sp. 21LCFQ010 TaxID=2957506 RepID=UPI0020974065|nr:NUDIX domain-containing protein [Pseudomonas sp. 21LCFQ010]